MDNEVKVRLTGEGGQLVGQLNTVAGAEERVAAGADKASAASLRLAAASARTEAAEANKARALASADRAQNLAAISAIRLAAANEKAAQSAARANGTATASLGALRSGQQQAGQQAQDFFIQLGMGTPFMTAFSQQASQMTGALALMSQGGGAATGIMGRFMGLMGGPFGIALGVAIPLVALLSNKLFENKAAAEEVTVAADNLADAQSLLGKMFDLSTGKIKNNTAALRDNIYMQMVSMQQKAQLARTEAAATLSDSGAGKTTSWERFSSRLMAIASQNPARYGANEQYLARREGAGRQFEDLGKGVAQGGITREEAGRMIEGQRKKLGDDKYFALQDYLNRSAEEFSANKAAKDLQTALGGKLPEGYLSPKDGPKRKPKSGGDEAAKLRQLEQFGERAAEKIQRINEQFDEQPKLVDRVNQSTRELDAIIKDLSERKPTGFADMIKQAEAAKDVVRTALVKPFNDMVEASGRARDVQSLILAGREDEATALQKIYQLQDQVGFVTREQREAILANVRAEEEMNKKLQVRQQLVAAYTSAIGDVRGQLEGLLGGNLGGKDFLKGIGQTFKQLQGRLLTEQLFGPALRQMEEEVKKRTGIQSSVDIMREGVVDAGNSASGLAGSLEAAAKRVDALFQPGGTSGASGGPVAGIGGLAATVAGLGIGAGAGAVNGGMAAAQQMADGVDEIVVEARRLTKGPMGLSVDRFIRMTADATLSPFMDAADKLFGGSFFKDKLQPILGEAFVGYQTGGVPGAVLGGLKEIGGLGDKLSASLGKAFKGAQTGTMVAGIGKSLGLNMSTTGSQIGGAIGGALPIPGGDIIGSILGGVVGGLFKKKVYGTAVLGGGDEATITGNKSAAREAAGGMADAVRGGLSSIAEQLGGSLGGYSVSIGTYKGKARVSASGKSGKLKGGDVKDFGKGGEEDAVAYAIADAIKDGAITGLTAAMQRAVQANAGNLDKALSEALKVKELEKQLGGFRGAAENAFREFETQAKDRLRIATAYGLNINKVEELNAKERIALRKQLEEQSFGSLQDLLTRMRSGDLFEGSAVDQRAKLLAEIDKTKDAAARGEEGAADKLAGLLDQLNTVSKDVYGTTGGFSGDRSNIETTAESVIALLKAQLDAADPSAAGMAATNNLLDENNAQNAMLLAELKRLGIVLTGGTVPGTSTPVTPTTPYNPAFNLGGLAYTGGGGAGISGNYRFGNNPLQ